MQHHVHAAPRNAPHIRTSYHHMATSNGQPMPVATATAVAPPPPPPASQSQQSQQHMRELSNTRLNNHHNHQQHHHQNTTQTLHSSSSNQMQKIRQQHQHLNNNNSNKVTAVLPTQPPTYNTNNTNNHTSHQHQQQQQQQHQQHLTSYNVGHFNHLAATPHQQRMAHVSSYPAGPPIHSGGNAGVHPTHQHQHQHHYYVGNKTKYNNNNNNNHSNNNYAPKSILQNPNRALKTTAKSKLDAHSSGGIVIVSADTSKDAKIPSCHSNNIIITPEAMPATAEVTKAPEHTVGLSSSSSSSAKSTGTSATAIEKTITTTIAAESVEDANSGEDTVEHQIGATLANEDSSVPRNSKDKTPMCLVNELARYNKITHQYRLTGERGPAHSKTFTVTLRLGDEEYSADGFKIKKAQHLAAAKAIEETKFKHPPPKTRRSEEGSGGRMHITPTVELNALAMKMGQRTYYLLDPTQIPPPNAIISADFVAQPGHHMLPQGPQVTHGGGSGGGGGSYLRRSGNFVNAGAPPPPYIQPGMPPPPPQQRYAHRGGYPPKYPPRYPMPPQMGGHMVQPHGPFASLPTTPSKITLFVGKQKFVGVGRTLQQAKHDAAARALQLLKTQTKTKTNEDSLDDSLDEGDKKSPISQVHEIGIKRSMTVHFKVLREEGPAHMKNFITACIVGSIVTEGEGNGKKISKKRAAEKMLTELQKLPPLTPTKQTPLKRIKVRTPGKPVAPSSAAATPNPKGERRKRLSAALKEKTGETDDSENPITKLIQLQQSRKEKEPIFELIAKNGNENSRRREFIMEVTAGSMVARGTGNNKKLAKRNAAQNLLNLMEVPTNDNKENAGEQTTQLKTSSSVDTAVPALAPAAAGAMAMAEAKKMDIPMISTSAGPVPGILILRQNKKHAAKKKESASAKQTNVETIQTKQDAPIEGGDTKTNNSTTNKSTTNESTTNTTENLSANTSTSTTNNDTNSHTSTATAATTSSTDTSNSAISEAISNKPDENASSTTTNATIPTTTTTTNSCNVARVHMKEQLLYLAKLLGFEVNFSDYPKGNHNEFLTIVTLSSDPPQICHGVGSSAEESQNDAAKSALKILSELGLNNAKNTKK